MMKRAKNRVVRKAGLPRLTKAQKDRLLRILWAWSRETDAERMDRDNELDACWQKNAYLSVLNDALQQHNDTLLKYVKKGRKVPQKYWERKQIEQVY